MTHEDIGNIIRLVGNAVFPVKAQLETWLVVICGLSLLSYLAYIC